MRNTGSAPKIRYALGMPTRGRTEALLQTLEAISQQTMSPERIFLVDNNEDGEVDLSTLDIPSSVVILPKAGSQILADQKCLEYATRLKYKYLVKWDDDLVPDKSCLERLVRGVSSNSVAATGGMYYQEEQTKRSWKDDQGLLCSGDGLAGHLQFSLWKGKHEALRVPALYSSFAYRVELANVIGGFNKDLKIHRHDTEFTIRLSHIGALFVVTNAVAKHLVSSGGVRSGDKVERKEIMKKDCLVFENKMRDIGVDPFNWRDQCGQGANNG